MIETYRNHTIETKTDIYTGYVTVTSYWNDDIDSTVTKGSFRNIESAVKDAKKRIDEFHEDLEHLQKGRD